jgi:hypothetical protein
MSNTEGHAFNSPALAIDPIDLSELGKTVSECRLAFGSLALERN